MRRFSTGLYSRTGYDYQKARFSYYFDIIPEFLGPDEERDGMRGSQEMVPIYQVPNRGRWDTGGLTERVVGLMEARVLCNIRKQNYGIVGHKFIVGR